MIVETFDQQSSAWFKQKSGRPSPSRFSEILTPTGQESKSWRRYALDLICEKHSPEDKIEITSHWLERGNLLEPDARAYYEFIKDVKVEEVGLVYLDEKKEICGSPDGLVGDDGGIEIKSPKAQTHIETLLANKMPLSHVPQVQGYLWICQREWIDFVSYHPNYKWLCDRQYRDEVYITKLKSILAIFLERMAEIEKQIIE